MKQLNYFLALCCIGSPLVSVGDEDRLEPYELVDRPLEMPLALDYALMGDANGQLVLTGGWRISTDGERVENREIWVRNDPQSEWESLGEMPGHVARAGMTVAGGQWIVVGGLWNGTPSDRVRRISFQSNGVQISELAVLPTPLLEPAVAILGRFLYLAGGFESGHQERLSTRFMRLDWNRGRAQWEELTPWPGAPRARASLIPAIESLHLLGGQGEEEWLEDAWSWHPQHGWRQKSGPPVPIVHGATAKFGESHVLAVSLPAERGGSKTVYAWHTVTDTWFPFLEVASISDRDVPVTAASWGNRTALQIGEELRVIEVLPVKTNYGWWDHVAVLVYLGGMVLMGVYFTSRRKNTRDFFRGGNQIPWWATGMSLFATGASAISLLAMPGKSYSTDWTYFVISICSIATLPLSLFLLAPLVRRLNFATANEYLDHRFGPVARTLASSIYIFTQIFGRMGPVMLLPSVAMSAITGIDISVAIIVMGVTVTLYTFLGGLSAVVWTDTVQGFVMVAAVLGCLILVFLRIDLSPGEIWTTLNTAGKLHTFDWGWEITYPTVWMIFLGTIILTLGGVGDQNYIQRMQCTPSLKDAQKAVATQMAVAVPINVLLFSLGTALFLFYHQHPQELNPVMKTDGIFPFFAAQQLPPGVSGLVVAALLAATMSTISSSVCSVANLGVDDFYRRFNKSANDRTAIVLGRWLTLLTGIVGVGAALFLARLSMPSIWDMALLFTNLISNGILGLFALGLLTRRAHQWGALCGVACGMVSVYFLQNHTEVTFWLFTFIGSWITFLTGYLFSLIIPGKPRGIGGLTVFTLRQEIERWDRAGEP